MPPSIAIRVPTAGSNSDCAGIVANNAHERRGPAYCQERQGVAGLKQAIENGMDVCNISTGATTKNFFATLHDLTDRAYFRNTVLVTAANNMPSPSFLSLYSSVVSVASHDGKDPYSFYYNPAPPVEFGAPGVDVRVAWAEGDSITATGNSFAAPHISGIVAKILGKHPSLTPFQIKTVLRALSANMTRE